MTATRDNLDVLLAEAASLALGHPRLPFPGADEPQDELILRYLDGALEPLEREEARQLINASDYGRERLAVLRESLAEADEESSTLLPSHGHPLRLSFLHAADGLRFLFGSLTPRSLVAVPVATRGRAPGAKEESSFFDFVHKFEDLEVGILIECVPGGRLDLQLQCDTPRIKPLRVSLSDRSGALLDSQPMEHGIARFASLPPASHRISITESRREIGRLFLDVHSA